MSRTACIRILIITLLFIASASLASCTSVKKEEARPKKAVILITEMLMPDETDIYEGVYVRRHIPDFALDVDGDGQDELIGKNHKGDICIFKRGKDGYRKVAESVVFEAKKNPEVIGSRLFRTGGRRYALVYAAEGFAGSKAALFDLDDAKLAKVWTSEETTESLRTTGAFPAPGVNIRASGIDIDGDGKGEVATLERGRSGQVYEWNGAEFVAERALPRIDGCVHALVFADVDGDKKAEMIATGHGFDESFRGFNAYTQNGDGWKQLKIDSKNKFMQESLAVGDIDGDGKQEVVSDMSGFTIYGYRENALVDIYYKAEDETDTPPYGPPQHTFRVAMADINGDGADEIVTITEKNPGVTPADIMRGYRIALHAWQEGTLIEIASKEVEATLLWKAIAGENSILVPYITIGESGKYHLKIAEISYR